MNALRFSGYAFALMLAVLSGLVATAIADETTGRGKFSGLSGHQTQGAVSVVNTADGYIVQLGTDFSFDGAPDPKVALGKDGQYDPATLMGKLVSNSGEQRYPIPAAIDVSQYNEVYIWCEKYAVGLGVATLE